MFAKEPNGRAEERVVPRAKRTRELIVKAFNALVAEKGHTGLTLQEIAERATINRATFYAHFTDQYELFDYLVSEAIRERPGRRLPESPGPSTDNLKALVFAACGCLAAQQGLLADGPPVQAPHRGAGAGRALLALAEMDRSIAGEGERPASQPGGYSFGGELVDLRRRVGLEP